MRRWYVRHHGASSMPLEERTQQAVMQEMYEDALLQKRDLEGMLDKGEGDASKVADAIGAINEFLYGEDTSEDPLVAEWDRQFDAGLTPDLDMTMEDVT